MKEKLQKIKEEAIRNIEASGDLSKLNDVRVAILGKKGELTAVLKGMKEILHLQKTVRRLDNWSMKCGQKLKQNWKKRSRRWRQENWNGG